MEKSSFKYLVIKVVSQIPYGKVVSYGQVALYIGAPRAARQVGWILNGLSDVSVPWWRVINGKGRISIKGSRFDATQQKILLEKEGVVVGKDFTLDIEKYRFIADDKFISELALDDGSLISLKNRLPLTPQRHSKIWHND